MIQRYEVWEDNYCKRDDGDWCKADDAILLENENNTFRKEFEILEKVYESELALRDAIIDVLIEIQHSCPGECAYESKDFSCPSEGEICDENSKECWKVYALEEAKKRR